MGTIKARRSFSVASRPGFSSAWTRSFLYFDERDFEAALWSLIYRRWLSGRRRGRFLFIYTRMRASRERNSHQRFVSLFSITLRCVWLYTIFSAPFMVRLERDCGNKKGSKSFRFTHLHSIFKNLEILARDVLVLGTRQILFFGEGAIEGCTAVICHVRRFEHYLSTLRIFSVNTFPYLRLQMLSFDQRDFVERTIEPWFTRILYDFTLILLIVARFFFHWSIAECIFF